MIPWLGSPDAPTWGTVLLERCWRWPRGAGESIPLVMNDSQSLPRPERLAPAKGTLFLAVVAPFGAIALLASPLIIDAARHAAGI